MIDLQPNGGFSDNVAISVVPTYPNLNISLVPENLLPPGQALLTITSIHTDPSPSGAWYKIRVIGTAGELIEEISVTLLVGGTRMYLPVVNSD